MDSEPTVRDSEDGDGASALELLTKLNTTSDLDIDDKKNLLSLYKLHYWRHPEVIITAAALNKEFGTDFTPGDLTVLLSDETVIQRLRREDVPITAAEFRNRLTPKQLEWIEVLLDPYTRKTLQARCRDFGITWQKHNAWMRNPLFADTLRQETNKLAADRRFEVLNGLINEAAAGNQNAAKLYLEWQGELKNEQTIHVTHEHKIMIHRIIDVLQEHVEPEVLEAVADKLSAAIEMPVVHELGPAPRKTGPKPKTGRPGKPRAQDL